MNVVPAHGAFLPWHFIDSIALNSTAILHPTDCQPGKALPAPTGLVAAPSVHLSGAPRSSEGSAIFLGWGSEQNKRLWQGADARGQDGGGR